ncbi:RidA family protein [Aeromonas caviae]|uniref:RidA family protein n=1 Tax=Aeromonas caviae TaxID=648 RepID=UPI002E18CA07
MKRRSSHFSCVNTVPVNTYDIVKVNIQLANIADLDAVNTVYTQYFPGYLPARTVIGVSELPAGALVQMDAVMSNAESTPPQV